MIQIDITTILATLANRYGNEVFLKKISQLFDIGLLYLKNKNLVIKHTPTKIIMLEEDNCITHTIELHEDYYTYTKDFGSYKVVKHYDYSKIVMRKSAIFKTSDQELLVVDEINEENIRNRRIIKTTEEDTEFINGSFEKEELRYQKQSISERYDYLEDYFNHKKVSKQVKLPDNLYVYSYRTTSNAAYRDYNYGFIESAACIDKPNIVAPGRIREKNELLLSSIKTPLPNILIRGRNVVTKEELEIELYNISIYKIGNNIQFTTRIVHLPENIQVSEEHVITSSTFGSITIEDINMLLDFITKNMDTTYLHELKQELNNIKNQLLIGSKEKRPDMDFIDSRLLMYSEFDYLVHDIHANLPKYEEVISKQTKKGDEDTPPTLKKNK